MDSNGPIIAQIYSAALDASAWPVALTSMQEQFGGIASGLYTFETTQRRTPNVSLLHLRGVDENYLSSYIERFLQRNPWAKIPELQAPRTIRTDRSLDEYHGTPGYYRRTALYNEWMKPQDFIHTLGTTLLHQGQQRTKFFVYRPRAGRAFTRREITRFGQLSGHMAHAVNMARRLAIQEHRLHAALHVIDRLKFGVIFLDGQARITLANRFAQTLLDQRDGIYLRDGMVTAAHRDDRRRLDGMVHLALNLHGGQADAVPRRVSLRRPDMKRPLYLMALPLPCDVETPFLGGRDAAVLLINDPESEPMVPAEWLRRRYGLTSAEARLARHLVRGDTLRGSAEAMGVTYETARGYLKLALQKTGSARQLELVRKILSEQVFLHGM
ncbi:MAG: helix-turn-helix transcriptional regulator [Proteobacteria bacterium]|nr:MAG: helix-turn-helix transcriptional regulator [Pseudomonadota bacterium]QKK11520.1 MAG: helix-turn-helix transcriptional regulator [Pseudomonadota bacterium]